MKVELKNLKIVGRPGEDNSIQWECVTPPGCMARLEQRIAAAFQVVVWIALGAVLGMVISFLLV